MALCCDVIGNKESYCTGYISQLLAIAIIYNCIAITSCKLAKLGIRIITKIW